MDFSVLFFGYCFTNTPVLPLTHSPPLPQFVCLLICQFPSLIFSFTPPCQSLCKSPSVHVCLSVCVSPSLVSTPSARSIFVQISNINHSVPSSPLRLLHPPSSVLVHLGVSQHSRAAGVSKFTQAATDR